MSIHTVFRADQLVTQAPETPPQDRREAQDPERIAQESRIRRVAMQNILAQSSEPQRSVRRIILPPFSENTERLAPLYLLSETFTPTLRPNRTRSSPLERLQQTEVEETIQEIGALSTFLAVLQSTNKNEHLLYNKEIHGFASLLLDEMKEVKKECLEKKFFSIDDITSISCTVMEAISKVSLLRLIEKASLTTKHSTLRVLFSDPLQQKTHTLNNIPSYTWLFDGIVSLKTLVCDLAEKQHTALASKKETQQSTTQALKPDLTSLELRLMQKDKAKQKSTAISDIENEIFKQLVALKIQIDRHIVNSFDPNTPDNSLPEHIKINWLSVYE